MNDYLTDEGHEVIGDTLGVFANAAARMGAHWIEVAEQNDIPVLREVKQK